MHNSEESSTPASPRGGIVVDDEGCVRRILIDRPDKANALSMSMLRDLSVAIAGASAAGADAIVLQGAGSKSFCAGADIGDLAEASRHEQFLLLQELIDAMDSSNCPIFSLIHGRVLGAGCLFPVLSDVVIAHENTVLGFPEFQFGLYPALMHAILLEKLTAPLVFQLCIGGRRLAAGEALSLGLITEVQPGHAFSAGVPDRIDYFHQRLAGLNLGRQLRRRVPAGLHDRVSAAEPILSENLGAPSVLRLLGNYLHTMRRA